MENISLPTNITFDKGKNENESIVNIWPCFPGYGTTLGNALRRVLLSSLPGAAVTSYKAKVVQHEFSTIPHIKENLVEISLNLKQLRLKLHSEDLQILILKVKGVKDVKASDIKAPSQVEIVNPDLHIATLTDKEAELDLEIKVERGRGYLPTENREKEEIEVGQINIDAIFTPIKNIGFKLDNVRVGQMTNYDKLILNIETDGTITPQEALNQATQILIDQFDFIAKNSKVEPKAKKSTTKVKSDKETKQKKQKAEKKTEGTED